MEMISIEELFQALMDAKPTTFDDYTELKKYKNRELYLEGVDSDSCKELVTLILDFNRADADIVQHMRKPILLYINSGGGNVTDGYALMDVILMSKTPVHTICIGSAYSMGGMVFLAGHKRIMYPRSSIMLHQGAAELRGDIGKLKDGMKFVDNLVKIGDDFVLERTKIPLPLYEQKQFNDWFLCASECLELGITDEIATSLY